MKYGSISTSSLADKVINSHLPETARSSNNRSSPVQPNTKTDSEGEFEKLELFFFILELFFFIMEFLRFAFRFHVLTYSESGPYLSY